MSDNSSIQFFLKFGRECDIQDLFQTGHIYVNPASYFKIDSVHKRYDRTEGRDLLMNLKAGELQLRPENETEWKTLRISEAKLERWLDITRIHIYSLFQITKEETFTNPYVLPDGIKEMGESYLLIKNPKQFMNRLITSIQKSEMDLRYGSVTYYPESTNHTQLGYFHKPERYHHQREYRILVDSDTAGPLHFYLGDLSDISEICNTEKDVKFSFHWRR